ncbi:sensor histidine kinase [Ruegeria lacuscaerulensis]|uniref:sensor histidine kinase n=1 Tax=Ruegeria lacuscaerulensis TaxID=55218 RepID=UPI0014807BB9|nr:HAMP domain-containing sensor histidine kinase [Ruegeria lacuscaerulensis]
MLPFLYAGALINTCVIVTYSIGIAVIQGPTTHFMSLFFLFSGALFASMHSHHLMPVLIIRLAIFTAAFLFIPLRDIVLTHAPIKSELWAQFFTSVFVLTFVLDSSRSYLKFYRTQIAQMNLLREEHARSEIAYKAKSEFVSTMSHELRTPLTSIKGSVDLAASGKLGALPEKVGFVLNVAQRNCERLLSLINEILDLQSVESGKMSFSQKESNLVELVEASVAETQPYAENLGVTLKTELPQNSILVMVDKARLKQVFANILSNAAKFSPPDSDVLVLVQEGDGNARVLFRDHGIGLSVADHETVFGHFTQIDSSDSRKIGGTGLGMNISMRIMEALGGSITYTKNAGPGTTFVVELPVANTAKTKTDVGRSAHKPPDESSKPVKLSAYDARTRY